MQKFIDHEIQRVMCIQFVLTAAMILRCTYHNTDGGGWTMFQHRLDGLVDFYWEWDDSKKGFGPLNRDFWLGLDKIHRLTSQKRL